MQDAAKRMRKLIQDLLSFTRVNIVERKFENTDLNKIVEEVKADLKEEIEAKHAIIETNEWREVNINPFQFRRLMVNLIENSLKFSSPKKPIYVKIKSEIVKGSELKNEKLSPEKIYCHITVKDNGIGFKKEFSEKIFELFQRLHGKSEYEGTGIGLAIVKKIVDNHNGVIIADSELGQRATFDIYLPAD